MAPIVMPIIKMTQPSMLAASLSMKASRQRRPLKVRGSHEAELHAKKRTALSEIHYV